jgi:hypothetical protein
MRSQLAQCCFVGLLLAGAGCGSNGTDLNQIVDVDPFAEAGAGSSSSGAGASFQDPFAGAPPYASHQGGDNSHNAGKSCIQSGCHGSGGGGGDAPSFLIGGTVYKDYQGKTAAPGVEVRVVDSSGNAVSTYSDGNGNFYISSSKSGLSFPLQVGARDGTTTRPMVTTLTTGMGSCGQASCHVPGGGPTTNTGNYYPIHIP